MIGVFDFGSRRTACAACTHDAHGRYPRWLPPRRRRGLRLVVVLLAAAVPGCAGAERPGPLPPGADPCDVAPASRAIPAPDAGYAQAVRPSSAPVPSSFHRTISVGVTGQVDPARAPAARTAAERAVFAQLYETLVRVTCDGRVEPLLASAWRAARDGREWTFTLRPDARDWDGAPFTAADVGRSWLAAQEALEAGAAPRAEPRFTAVTVVDPHTLRVTLAEPVGAGFFGRPELAVRTAATTSGWPNGSGPYRPYGDIQSAARPAQVVSLERRADGARLDFRTIGQDPRYSLDAGVDLLVTSDPAAIDYAASSAAFATVPLDWDRSYLLIAAAGAPPDTADATRGWRLIRPPESDLAALARDAVHSEARAAHTLAADAQVCGPARTRRPGVDRPQAGLSDARPALGASRIVYPATDAVARALAERLVALALSSGRLRAGWLAERLPALVAAGGPVSAAGLPPARFTEALRSGRDVAYVLPVTRRSATDPCGIVRAVLGDAPWLDRTVSGAAGFGPVIVPLVDTRSTLVIRRDIGSVAVDGNGTLLLGAVRVAAPEGEAGAARAPRTPRPRPVPMPGGEP